MFRNQYDTDVTTWSPAGRIHQVEYAMEAVKQGSAALGLRSKTHVVIAALKRASSDQASFQKKVFPVDDHVGIAIAGLTADGRLLCKFMRNECLTHKYIYENYLPVSRLVGTVGDKSQICTQRSSKRPYGVGLLVAGVDSTGPHLFQTCPSGNVYEYKAVAIGARSQSAKTYLEKHFERFVDCSVDELIHHALLALRETVGKDAKEELTAKNCSVGLVGIGSNFTILEGDSLAPYMQQLEADEMAAEPVAVPADAAAVAAPPAEPAPAAEPESAPEAASEDPRPPSTPMDSS
mmetsp:Transcript_24019/g.41329  ORF Transcript_24019/g.41329 Transcript_24019/m.41329 type:complete len:292 (-) Transcript_24019:196-1071(-)